MSVNIQRHIDVAGLINFRDLGDYSARNLAGKLCRTKSGVLYRSGHFNDMGAEAQQALLAHNIQRVFDFRSPHERNKKPSLFLPSQALEMIELDLDPGSGASFQQGLARMRSENRLMDGEYMQQVMCDINRSLVSDHADVYRQFFKHLLEDSSSVSVIHCASGKDRTGFASALLLSALGVDRETVIQDYMLTNTCLDVHHHVARAMADFDNQYATIMQPEVLTAMYEVRPEYLVAALDDIDAQHGGMQTYLQEKMQLGPAELLHLQNSFLMK